MSYSAKSQDLPKIRQTLFILDTNRQYLFDVNQNVTIRNLKKMIAAAANIGKVGLRIFHEGIEYTDRDPEHLDDLFPNLQKVIFDLRLSYEHPEDLEKLINLDQMTYCPEHNGKYLSFYCYTCDKSICTECLKNKHKGHKMTEKYDYLQDSRNIIEKHFHFLKKVVDEGKEIDENSVQKLRARITMEFIPHLVEMVKQIEANLLGLIDFYLEKKKGNIKTMKINVDKQREYFAEGLDKLKKEIIIDDIIIDENVFRTIDNSIKDLMNKKDSSEFDVLQFRKFTDTFKLIQSTVNKLYQEIETFLNKYIDDKVYTEIKAQIDASSVSRLEKQKILDLFLSNIKRSVRDQSSQPNPFNLTGVFEKKIINSPIQQKEDVEMHQTATFNTKSGLPTLTNVISIPPQSEDTTTTTKDKLVCKVNPGSKQISIFSSEKNKIVRKTLEFSSLIGIQSFLFNCAWVNEANKLYISGGMDSNNPSRTFFLYDPSKNTLTRLQDMKMGHSHHSMFATKDYIYVIGGQSLQCERYSKAQGEWTMLPNLIFDQKYPTLYIHNNYLYSFFGLDSKDNYIDIIQRLNLRNDKGKWENVSYIRNGCDVKMYGCGINQLNENEIRFFGGKDEKDIRQTVIKFSFKGFRLEKTIDTMEEKAYFKDSKLIELDAFRLGNFSLEDLNSFLIISQSQ